MFGSGSALIKNQKEGGEVVKMPHFAFSEDIAAGACCFRRAIDTL